VEFVSSPPLQFSGIVQPGGSVQTSVAIPSDTVTATVQIAWGPLASLNDLAVMISDQAGIVRGQANKQNSLGLNGQREVVSLTIPAAGSYQINVRNGSGLAVTAQKFYGVLEVTRAHYAGLNDVAALSPAAQADVFQSLRSFTMWPVGSRFASGSSVSRTELAAAMVRSGRVPQYLPGQSAYRDVRDNSTMLFVESAQASPTGPLFIDVIGSNHFRPFENVNRLTAAVALIRAAGLRSEAEAKAGAPLAFLDGLSVPSALRGYVSVAVAKGLIQADSAFRPQASFTRLELARANAVIQRMAIE
jgi:hypothetical protein